ncbi:MAG TPA: ATP synthase F1 subunit delta [Candidatus Marinimicrobia bacterium]|nr:ATP synthase F1 subunit delta [Candidatus Neomarinimicrobiota bacterium]
MLKMTIIVNLFNHHLRQLIPMKQNHKKIKIYSTSLCSLVTDFEEFKTTKIVLNDFVVLMKKDSTINAFLQSKSIDKNQKVAIFKNALNGVVNSDLLDIIIVMVENDDINLLSEVNKNFLSLTKEKLNVAYVEVIASFDMGDDSKNNLLQELKTATKKEIDFNFSVDKSLIGGLKIKVDDMLFDSSLKTKLENAKLKLIGV